MSLEEHQENKRGYHCGRLVHPCSSPSHCMSSLVSYWRHVDNWVAASALLKQFCRLQGWKGLIANLSLGCSPNSEESLWQVIGTPCCVVEGGAQSWLRALVKILLASWPRFPTCNRAAARLPIHFIYTDHFQSEVDLLMYSYWPSHSLVCTYFTCSWNPASGPYLSPHKGLKSALLNLNSERWLPDAQSIVKNS